MDNQNLILILAKTVALRHFFSDIPQKSTPVEVAQQWDAAMQFFAGLDDIDETMQYMDVLFLSATPIPNVPQTVFVAHEYDSAVELYNGLHGLATSVIINAAFCGLVIDHQAIIDKL